MKLPVLSILAAALALCGSQLAAQEVPAITPLLMGEEIKPFVPDLWYLQQNVSHELDYSPLRVRDKLAAEGLIYTGWAEHMPLVWYHLAEAKAPGHGFEQLEKNISAGDAPQKLREAALALVAKYRATPLMGIVVRLTGRITAFDAASGAAKIKPLSNGSGMEVYFDCAPCVPEAITVPKPLRETVSELMLSEYDAYREVEVVALCRVAYEATPERWALVATDRKIYLRGNDPQAKLSLVCEESEARAEATLPALPTDLLGRFRLRVAKQCLPIAVKVDGKQEAVITDVSLQDDGTFAGNYRNPAAKSAFTVAGKITGSTVEIHGVSWITKPSGAFGGPEDFKASLSLDPKTNAAEGKYKWTILGGGKLRLQL
ncbi:hypothetical protein DB347_17680 [Opitutaceae bacterium EW11]|nr:hypothetical protein DB347_17680 [Opitutaceae bacterium EW11]